MDERNDNATNLKFNPGHIVATQGSLAFMEEHGIIDIILLARHIHGDWGDLCEEDKQVNEEALKHGGRLMSSYKFDAGDVWIITEHDRSVTTFLLPSEY